MESEKSRIVRISAYGVILREREILLCRLSPALKRYGGMWTLPGGGLDFGEHPEAGMVREVREETGLTVHSANLIGVHSFTRDFARESFQGIQLIYDAAVVDGTLTHEVNGTTDMCKWHSVEEITNLERVELVDVALSMSSNEFSNY
ncbi:MAG: NUDIX domain-containing protein [Gammaproteobacteria bacterium]|jgi:8-oxo-dGTP diphosphatase|nr:NUDIX domain-containing protein [Gammaproteobacteria bacterium]